jgi:hypothetical protein
MNKIQLSYKTIKSVTLFSLFFAAYSAKAEAPTKPETDPNFLTLSDGRKLSNVKVNGVALSLARGSGSSFGSTQKTAYLNLKEATQSTLDHKVQWAFMDLDSGQIIDRSLNADKRIFGASSSKVFVAATLLDRNRGAISNSQLQLMASMIVVSSNTAWTNLQTQIGNGNSNLGRQRNYEFTQRMGYEKTLGFQGWWGNLHGNELTANETVRFLYDTYHGNYHGAETLWKIMYTCRTGASRARKYLPKAMFVGGKTGSYDGPTFDTDTGKNVSVRVRNHLIVFNAEGTQYALMVLANNGSDETAALLAGGLYREHVLGL